MRQSRVFEILSAVVRSCRGLAQQPFKKTSPTVTRSLIAVIAMTAAIVRAGDPNALENSWTSLTDAQPSRQQLFERVKAATIGETGEDVRAIPLKFFFPEDARIDKIRKVKRDKTLFGIDVSHHNGNKLNLDMLRNQNVYFVYAKATQGRNFKDPRFSYYWKALAALKPQQRPLRGAYHFLTALDDPTEQAERFVQYVNLQGGFQKDDMPPCLDLEWDVTSENPDQWAGQSPEKIVASAMAWLQKTQELTRRTPVIYTARSWWLERGIPEAKFDTFKDYPIWIADYSKSHKATEKPATISSRTQSLWQFADDARLKTGYEHGKLDANIFYGSETDFSKEFGLGR